ncbi:major facilitator superfamily domain-containing protein 6 [Trichonephila clavata]|uniref:Major facilitator superfamily domain-containing protein 6 n=1 Tax=Trichonephila clavata TaxID=2740835 RepID=A0A8X6KWC8_TRICU|nr:major facilitator superfamily domain-containing protein 6 [Trichonephila clavata]
MVGMVADKIGNFKFIFSFFLTFSAITANLLLLVPPVSQADDSFNFSCDSKSNFTRELTMEDSCEINPKYNNTIFNMTMIFRCEQECKNATEYYSFPLLLQKDGSDCNNHCDNTSTDGCKYINRDSAFDLHLDVLLKQEESNIFFDRRRLNYLINHENETFNGLLCPCLSHNCNIKCKFFNQTSKQICEVEPPEEEFGVTFWSYLGIRLIVTLGIGLVNGLFDSASMTIIQDLKADVGFQRFWSTVGMCLFAPISGYFVDEYDNFKPCFFMYGILYLIAAATSLKLDLSMKLPSDNPLRNLAKLVKNPEVDMLLLQIAALGICWGFLENFLFWFLESELGSNNLIMGLTVTVGSGTGLFMALVATWFTRKLGYVNIIIIAFAAYTVRFFGYALAQDAYFCLIFEMMENFTVTLLTVGVTMYCTELASLEMLTTVMTLWNGLHVISGRAFGSLLGGFLVNNFGFRQTFKFFAYGCIGFGSFYALMYITWLRQWRKNHRKASESDRRTNSSVSDEKDEEAMKNQAFSSFSLHCSFDSPGLVTYTPEKEDEFRPRALSHIPAHASNSFKPGVIPRHAVSFTEGKFQRPFTIGLSAAQDSINQKRFQRENVNTLSVENNKLESVTRF